MSGQHKVTFSSTAGELGRVKAARLKEREDEGLNEFSTVCAENSRMLGTLEGRSCKFSTQRGLKDDLQVMLQSRERMSGW